MVGLPRLELGKCWNQNPVPYQLGYSPVYLVESKGIEPLLSACKAEVLTVITKTPYFHHIISFYSILWRKSLNNF